MERIGERFIPDKSDLKTEAEHLHRYLSISNMVEGKSVVDLGCGHGYGSQILINYESYIGIDIDDEVIQRNSSHLSSSSARFLTESADELSIPSQSIDVVVCFEMIEHVQDPKKVLSEAKRVLKPNGILISSTPDKSNYNVSRLVPNEFHLKELEKTEYQQYLDELFVYNRFFGQSFLAASFLLSERHTGNIAKIIKADDLHASLNRLSTYWVAISSNSHTDLEIDDSLLVCKLDRNYDEEISLANIQLNIFENELNLRTNELLDAHEMQQKLETELQRSVALVSDLEERTAILEDGINKTNARLEKERRLKDAYKDQVLYLLVRRSTLIFFLRRLSRIGFKK